MAFLYLLLCISVTNLVRCDDNVAMESGVSYQETYKVHPDSEDSGHQQVQYIGEHQDYSHGDQKHYQYQYVQQHESSPHNEGHTTLAEVHGVEEVQPIAHQHAHQQHQTYKYVHHHQRPHPSTRNKVKYNSQASHVKHINEKEGHHKTLGFHSYVEHVSDKDEEAAIKEGSIGDIKKLVPKSGISFKIYHNDKQTGSQKTHQSSHSYQHLSGLGKEEESSHVSGQHHNLKVEVPVTPISIQHDYGSTKGSQYYLKDQTIDHEIENIHPNIGVVGNHGHQYHSEDEKAHYYTQIEGSSQKPSVYEVGGKTSVLSELKSSNHGSKATSTVEFNKNLNIFSGHKSKSKEGFRKEITKFQYKKPSYYLGGGGKTQISLKKPLKHLGVTVKPTESYLESDLHTGEKITQSHVQHSESGATKEGLSSYISDTTGSSHISVDDSHGVHFGHTTASPHLSLSSLHGGHQALITHSTSAPLIDIESGKDEHSSFSSSHLSSSHEGLKTSHAYIDHTKLSGVEESKGSLHGVISHSTVSPHATLHESYSHSTAGPIIEFEAGKGGHGSFHTQLSSSSHEGGGHDSSYVSHLSTSHISTEEEKGGHTSLVSHSPTLHQGSLESLKTGHVSFHSTVTPLIDFKSPKEGLSSYASHTTSKPHAEAFVSGGKHSVPSSHISFELGKGGYHTTVSHTTASPHIEGNKESHFSILSHSTATPHVSLELHKGGYITHTTPKPSFESTKGGYITHTTAIPHVSLESAKGGYVSHTTSIPHIGYGSTSGGGYVTHTTAIPHVTLESAKGGYVSHTTVSPHLSLESLKDHSSLLSHSTSNSHLSSGSHGLSYSTVSPHVSIKGSHDSIMSHTTASPHLSLESLKDHSSLISHSVGNSHLSTDSHGLSYSTISPHISIKGSHDSVISHATASPHLSLESLKDHSSLISHSVGNSHLSTGSHGLSYSTVSPHVSIKGGHGSIITHTTAVPQVSIDLSKLNQHHETAHSFSEIEIPKLSQSHFVKHLSTNTYLDSEALKGSEHAAVGHTSVLEIDSGGKGQGLTHVPINTYIDAESTKTGQKNFDHQKALEGSTSFDFKNAIGSAEPLTHQVQITPAHVEHLGKQTLTYIVPKIPLISTPVPLVDNHIHETVVEKQPTKHFAFGGGLTAKYPMVSLPDLSGKLTLPQSIKWSSEHLKHGSSLTTNDIHQPLVNLHFPKQELIKHTKFHKVEVPTSYISHQPVIHQKAPVVIHHETPVIKYTQDLHYGKKIPQVQHIRTNHIKSLPMTNIDWSLYKSQVPKINMNTVLLKPELMNYMHEPGKKIIPILVKKRKNRSSKDVEGIIYGKTAGNRGPVKPNHRNDKGMRGVFQQEGNRGIGKPDTNSEFSVSASYKVDRSLQTMSEQ